MKFTISVQALGALLAVTDPVAAKSHIPRFGLVSAEDDGCVSIVANNEICEVTRVADALVTEPGAACVDLSALHTLASKLTNNSDVSFYLDTPHGPLSVRNKRSSFKLSVLEGDRYVRWSPGHEKAHVSVPAHRLAELLTPMQHAMSNDDTRPMLNGVFLTNEKPGETTLVATDGHRLALRSVYDLGLEIDEHGLLLPREAIRHALRFLDGQRTAGVVLYDDVRRVTLVCDGNVFSMKTIDGSFPEFRRVIPSSVTTSFTVVREEAVRAIDTLSAICGVAHPKIVFRVSDDGDVLQLSAGDAQRQGGIDQLDLEDRISEAEMRKADFVRTFAADGAFMGQAMKAIDTSLVEFRLSSERTPIVMAPVVADGQPIDQGIELVMPMAL